MKYSLALLIATLNSFYSYAQPTPHNQLHLATSYQVEWIAERPLMDYSYLNIILDKDNKAYGLAGCNYWSTTYQLKGNRLHFNPAIKITKKNCAPALMEQEQRFLKVLPTITRWDFSELGQLRLWPKKGKPIKLWQEEDTTNAQ